MFRPSRAWVLLLVLLAPAALHGRHVSFEPGDIFVSLEPGPIQWRSPDGTLRSVLVPTVIGTGEGMAFDSSGNLYITRWCIDGPCDTGNSVEMFNVLGQSMGQVGGNFDCNPHTIVILPDNTTYVGEGGCRKRLIKFIANEIFPLEYRPGSENLGVFWMDLAADGCTMFYTSAGPNVKRFDVCTNTQLTDFNIAPMPGGITQDLRVLPDGGVIVSSGQVIARLDSTGALTQTYSVPGEGALWAGVELDANGTFWAGNYFSSNVHKFNLGDGARVAMFNTGTPANTVVGIRVKK